MVGHPHWPKLKDDVRQIVENTVMEPEQEESNLCNPSACYIPRMEESSTIATKTGDKYTVVVSKTGVLSPLTWTSSMARMISRTKSHITSLVRDKSVKTTSKVALSNAQNNVARKSAYRAYVIGKYGLMGNGHCVELSSCVRREMRLKWPDPDGVYMEFEKFTAPE